MFVHGIISFSKSPSEQQAVQLKTVLFHFAEMTVQDMMSQYLHEAFTSFSSPTYNQPALEPSQLI